MGRKVKSIREEDRQSGFYLLDKVIDKFENSANDWREEADGNRSFKIQQSDYDAVGKSWNRWG